MLHGLCIAILSGSFEGLVIARALENPNSYLFLSGTWLDNIRPTFPVSHIQILLKEM